MPKKGYTLALPSKLTPGQCVRISREMLDMSQSDLSKITGLPQSVISGIETGRIKFGVERAKILAVALQVHPSVILFSNWEEERKKWLGAAINQPRRK